MAGRQPATDKLLVTLDGKDALVKVVGRGTFKVSAPLREFGIAAIERNCERIVFDMSGCVGMDSTFMGTIAGLSLRLRERLATGRVILRDLSDKTYGLVKTLGLDQIADVCRADPGGKPTESMPSENAGGFETLIQRTETEQKTTETMLDAHEALVDIEPENINKFRDVIDFLREDLNRNAEN